MLSVYGLALRREVLVLLQLRRDVLEQMPPSNYSLEALECHIRCHPVGAHAATYVPVAV